jgi:hypothetical protein
MTDATITHKKVGKQGRLVKLICRDLNGSSVEYWNNGMLGEWIENSMNSGIEGLGN